MQKNKSLKQKAKQEIISFIAEKYIRLDMNLDACQGCTDKLDEKFALLRYYKNLLKLITGFTDEQVQNAILTSKRYSKIAKLREAEYLETQYKSNMRAEKIHQKLNLQNKSLFDMTTDEMKQYIDCYFSEFGDAKDVQEIFNLTTSEEDE